MKSRSIKLPCSSMTREVVLLKAFEAGADAVVVLVCPEGSCRYLEGNHPGSEKSGTDEKVTGRDRN